MNTGTRATVGMLVAVAAAALLAVLAASPASADPPPAAAGSTFHGFLTEGSVVRPIDHPLATTVPAGPNGGAGTGTIGINDRGQIVGLVYDAQGGSRAFLYERGRYTLFDGTRDATYTRALDVDNRGRIVGDYGTRPRATAQQRTAERPGAPDRLLSGLDLRLPILP